MLDREKAYFDAHREALYGDYADQYVVICGEEVVAVAPDAGEAYLLAIDRGHEPGTFLIAKVTLDEGERTRHFHSRVGAPAVMSGGVPAA